MTDTVNSTTVNFTTVVDLIGYLVIAQRHKEDLLRESYIETQCGGVTLNTIRNKLMVNKDFLLYDGKDTIYLVNRLVKLPFTLGKDLIQELIDIPTVDQFSHQPEIIEID